MCLDEIPLNPYRCCTTFDKIFSLCCKRFLFEDVYSSSLAVKSTLTKSAILVNLILLIINHYVVINFSFYPKVNQRKIELLVLILFKMDISDILDGVTYLYNESRKNYTPIEIYVDLDIEKPFSIMLGTKTKVPSLEECCSAWKKIYQSVDDGIPEFSIKKDQITKKYKIIVINWR